MKRRKTNPVFKPYDVNNQFLIPPSWDEFISVNHPVRLVNDVINRIDISSLESEYEGGGRANYHPRMLLKLLVYGYLSNIYSSRKLEAFAAESMHCLWLTNLQRPDHNTINRFRSSRLKNSLKKIFSEVVKLLMESGHVSLQEVYVDGTKIEANANKYSFVWGKAIKHYKEKIGKQLEELWQYAEGVAKEEMQQNNPVDFSQVDKEMVKHTIEAIDKALKEKEVSKQVKQKLNYGKKNWEKSLTKYEQQERILGERNSYSKTDEDATFMRMKEDPMLNGQLKPAYNVQISTQNQIVVDYSIHQRPTDTTTLKSHLTGTKELYGKHPEKIIADAGYGSEENYHYLATEGIQAYVKYNMFDKEQRGKAVRNFSVEQLHYNKEQDCYYCPMGQAMHYAGDRHKRTENGYEQVTRVYRAINCQGCPVRGVCHKGQGQRAIEINERLNAYRKKAGALLRSEKGIAYRKKRCCDVEPVFGNMKHNKGFRRYFLRGIKKVAIETGLVYLAHNLKKAFAMGFTLPALNQA